MQSAMLRWMPRWHSVSRLRIAKPFTPVRLASIKPKPKEPHQNEWISWLRRQFSAPVLHQPPFSRPVRFLIYAFIVVTSGHIFLNYIYTMNSTYGVSMLPTLASFGDWVFISKYYRRGRGIKTGDIVSFKHPVLIGDQAIKRVLAMEGDFVLMNTPGKSEAMIQVPQGHCWVVGDNMLHSRDSRMFGPLPLALINGKVTAKMNWQGYLPQVSRIEHGFKPAYIEDDVD